MDPVRGQERPPGHADGPRERAWRAGAARAALLRARRRGATALPPIRQYTDAREADNLANTHLVAPFFRTAVGTDKYADELW